MSNQAGNGTLHKRDHNLTTLNRESKGSSLRKMMEWKCRTGSKNVTLGEKL